MRHGSFLMKVRDVLELREGGAGGFYEAPPLNDWMINGGRGSNDQKTSSPAPASLHPSRLAHPPTSIRRYTYFYSA